MGIFMSTSSTPPTTPRASTILAITPEMSLYQFINMNSDQLKRDFDSIRCLLLERYEPTKIKVWRYNSTYEAMRTKDVLVKLMGKEESNLVIITFEIDPLKQIPIS